MELRDVRRVLRHQPFCPLRFHLADGTTIEIDHPDMARLGRTAITLGLPATEEGDRDAVVPLESIVWVEVIVRPERKEDKSSGNGA